MFYKKTSQVYGGESFKCEISKGINKDLKLACAYVCVGNVQVPVSILVLGKAKFALTLSIKHNMHLKKYICL